MSNLSEEEKIKRFPVDCYTRTVGWFAATKSFNPGKLSEWQDRKKYELDNNK